MLRRLVLLLSLVGMALALHLWIQKEREFDSGCWGLSSAAPVASGEGCRAPALQELSEVLGISTAAWGYGFYFAMAAFSFAKIVLPSRATSFCHTAQTAAVGIAFPFSAYLVYYQLAVAKAYCPLCLISSGLIAVLFLLQIYQSFWGTLNPLSETERLIELGYASGMVFATTGALAAILLFVNQVATPKLDRGVHARQVATVLEKSLPLFIDADRLREMEPAVLDRASPTLKMADWVSPSTPALGRGENIQVITFLDPNCAHCVHTFSDIVRLSERFQDRAKFYILPRALWNYSVPQVAALEIAAQQGKYYEMWERQLSRQKKGGLRIRDLETIFRELGIDSSDLKSRLDGFRPRIRAAQGRATAAGVNSTPAIFVNGFAVAPTSRSESRLAKVIEQELSRHRANSAFPSTSR